MRSLDQHLVRRDDGLDPAARPRRSTRAPRTPATSRATSPACARTAASTPTRALWAVLATASLGEGDARRASCFACSTRSTTRGPRRRSNATRSSRTSSRPTSTRAPRTSGAAAGPGTRARPAGCTAWPSRAILGLRLRGDRFRVDPTIPNDWPRFELTYRHGGATYPIVVENPDGVSRGVRRVELDGSRLPSADIPFTDDGGQHHVRVELGPVDDEQAPR